MESAQYPENATLPWLQISDTDDGQQRNETEP